MRLAYTRVAFLLHNLAETPADAAASTLDALIDASALLRAGSSHPDIDASLFYDPLVRAVSNPACPALLDGGATGLLYADNRLSETDLLERVAGSLRSSATEASRPVDFLLGLLRACREIAWRQPAVIEALDALLVTWTDDEFIARVPNLRLAFAELTPRETDRVAEVVSQVNGAAPVGPLHSHDLTEQDMIDAVRVNAAVEAILARDGLSTWMHAVEHSS